MATTTLTFETLLADNQGQPPYEGTPSDTKNYSSDYFFWSTGLIDITGGSWEDQRPALNLNTVFGDLTIPGSGYAWMNLAGFEAAITSEFGFQGHGIWLKTKQSERIALPTYSPTMTAVRAFLDVEARASEWSGEAPELRAEIGVSGNDISYTAIGDWQPVAVGPAQVYTFPLRNLSFEFGDTPESQAFYRSQFYDPFWDAATSNRLTSLLWPGPARGGIFEIGWIRLRVEIDFGAVPYRRIFPRDDGLAGGSPRTYPPSRGVQSSNRIVGGYL